MIVQVEAGGRTHAVEVRRRNGAFAVVIDGREHAVDVSEVNGSWSLLVGPAGGPPEGGPHDRSSLGTGESDEGVSKSDVGAGLPGAPKLETSEGGSRPSRSYEVALVDGPDGTISVHVDGQLVPVSVVPSRPARGVRPRDGARHAGVTTGPHRIAAPMPGKIVRMLVTAGDRVAARQGVVIVEAMKMENEIRSPKAGIVAEVLVQEGASVEAGAILVVVE